MMTAPTLRRGTCRRVRTAANRISQDRQVPTIGADANEFPGSTIHHITTAAMMTSNPGAA